MDKKTVLSLSKRAAQRQLHLITGKEPVLRTERTHWHSSHGIHGFWFDFTSHTHYVSISGNYKTGADNINRLTVSCSPKEL